MINYYSIHETDSIEIELSALNELDGTQVEEKMDDPNLAEGSFLKYRSIGLIKDPNEENKEVEGYIPVCNLDMRAIEGNPQVPYYKVVHVIIGILKLKTAKIDKYRECEGWMDL